ncbi:MAG: sugar phosphate isomerase/epimerase [Planctomycetaceae bacterium]|nr:sugar phosphate isomerase/epimerase [Planctomycetaceae bacterium]
MNTNRRSFIKSLGGLGILAGTGLTTFAQPAPPKPVSESSWNLTMSLYSFRNLDFEKAVEWTSGLGIKFCESFAWQKISANDDEKVDAWKSTNAKKRIKSVLDNCGVKMVQCYIGSFAKDKDGNRPIFEWAKELGVETFVSEPPFESLDMLESLCDEYSVNIALHNHRKGTSIYWSPEIVLEQIKSRSKRLGACPDTGHWARTGLDLAESLKVLQGRIFCLHVKDIVEPGNPATKELPWGDGKTDLVSIFREIARQKTAMNFGIEYENFGSDTRPDIKRSIAYFNDVALKIKG